MKTQKPKITNCLLLVILVFLLPVCLFAKISPLVNFQGYITDKSGMPVADGSYDIKFSIYNGDDETASELWNEIQTVSVKNGFYTVSLGAVTAFKDPNKDTDESDALGFSEAYYLGIKVRKEGESSWDEIGFDARYLPLSSVWSAFRSKSASGRLIAIKDQNAVVSDAEDMLLVVGQTRIALSSALNAAGRMITIKKVDPKGTIVSIITKNGETIDGINYDPNDGSDPLELTEKFQEINLISDGRNWISTAGGITSSNSGGTGTELEPGIITTSFLADRAVTTSKLADNSVTAEKLSLENHAINYDKLELTNAITNAEISANAAIAYTKIHLTGAIDTKALADHSVTAKKLDLAYGDLSYSMINLTGLIINSDISENANIDYSKLNLNGALTNGDIADNASISHTKIDLTGISAAELLGSASISYENIQLTERIKNTDISPSAGITYNKLTLTESIQTNDLLNGAVTYPKLNLNNGDIPYAKISLNQSITNMDIADNAGISYNKLNLQDSISTGDLLNGAITANKIARDAIRSDSILDQSVSTDDLANESVTADKLSVSQAGTSGQVLSTDGTGGLFWQTPSGSGTSTDELSKLTVSGLSTLNSVTAQSAVITQASVPTFFLANQADILTLTTHQAHIQSLAIGETNVINLAQEPRTITLPNASGKILISGQPVVTAIEITNNAIENRHIGEGAIQNENIASNAQIPYSKLMLQNAIQNNDIANNSIAYEKLQLADSVIPYTVLHLTGAIQSTDIATGAVNYSALNINSAIQSKDIQDGTIQSQDLADNIILPQKLSGIHSHGNLKEALMSDGGGGFYWDKASPFQEAINEVHFTQKFGTRGTGDGQFEYPSGIAVISNGSIYVAERSNNRIQVFSNEGAFLFSFGSEGTTDGRFKIPQGMAVDVWDNIYVVDRGNHRIQKFKADGTHIFSIGSYGTDNRQFIDPYGMAVDNNGKIYVADTGNHRIQIYTEDGLFDFSFGSEGSGEGEFMFPYDVGIDRSGNIFVLDNDNSRVQKFDRTGNFIFSFGHNGTSSGEFGKPYGMTVDPSGYVIVADTTNNRIQLFNTFGQYKLSVGTLDSGISDGQFNGPYQVAVDQAGKIYVADTSNHRIQIFKPEPPVYTIVSTAIGVGTTNPYTATALQIDSTKGGLLIPRMTYNERELIEQPIQGLLVYQTDGHSGFYFYNGTEWINFDSNIYDESVVEQKIASDAITGTKVKDSSLTGDDILDQSLSISKLTISGQAQDGHMLVADGNALKWQAYDKLTRILTVGDGGQYASITAALSAITDNSDLKRYLIKVGPGLFMEQITLKAFVDIEGSGENVTIILFSGGNTHSSTDASSATVIGNDNCEIRFLTIVSQSSQGNYAVAVYNSNVSPVFQHVTIKAVGALENIAMYNANTAIPKIYHSTLTAMTGTTSIGIQNMGSDIQMRDSVISSEGSTTSIGILHAGDTILISDVEQSRISASTQSIQATTGKMRVTGSRLEGLVSADVGIVSCVGVYGVINNEIGFYQNSCPGQ
ncbi:MAG: 6-bladed beta-propeller [Candidatus Magnetomorum sp.]|nr:6-bladed beta-propeller [Candidatus Magnetomorum sp.]